MSDEFNKIIKGQLCPYCHCETKLVKGEVIYPHLANTSPRPIFLDKNFYMCIKDSDHYVGTYRDNVTSLGRLADEELRKLKNEGHRIFDPLWKTKKVFESQSKAYEWLSQKIELPQEFTHFGMFTAEQCKKAIALCENVSCTT